MGSIEAWLETKPRLADEAPTIRGHIPSISDDDVADAAVVDASDDDGGGIDSIFAMIEYIDGQGVRSRRRITFQRFDGPAPILLQAYCHERRAPRSFYLSRIACFISEDGEVLEPEAFWRSIGVRVALPSFDPPRQVSGEVTAWVRRHMRHQLILLAGLSRVDGRQDRAEIDRIVDYALIESERHNLLATDADIEALNGYVRRLRPTREALNDSLEGLYALARGRRIDADGTMRLFRAAMEVAEADGQIAASEFAFLNEVRDVIARLAGKP